MKLDDLEIPATPACRAALEVATAYCSPALLNHSVRAYLWAAGYGRRAASPSTPSCSTSRPCSTTSPS